MSYTAAVITISDKGARGERVDTSGPAICEMLRAQGYDVVYTNIIPDEREQICAELIACADEKFYGQFDGKTESDYKNIDAISGATLTTNGYLKAIERAFEALNTLKGESN